MFKKVDKHSPIPSYLQIMNLIKKEIMTGVLKAGDKLPGVRDLQIIFGVNVNTVLKALGKLQIEEVVEARHGVGFFIQNAHKIDNSLITQIKVMTEKLKQEGCDLHTAIMLVEEVWHDKKD